MINQESKIIEYVEPIYLFCLKRLSDRQNAEDLSQEILIHIIHGLSKYKVNNLQAWVWQIAHNRYVNFIDSRKKQKETQFGGSYIIEDQDNHDIVDKMIIREEHQAVFNILHTLSFMYRKIIVDYYVL